MDPISEQKLAQVHPWLAHLGREMDARLSAQLIPIRVVQGLRSWNDQLKEWLQGRDENGNVVDKKKIVTNAPPGHSWHEFGLAIDVCPVKFLDIPNWGAGRPEWDNVVSVGEGLGLCSGSRFVSVPHDWPHFQLTGKLPVSPDDETRELFKEGLKINLAAALTAVWDAANIQVYQ